MKNMNNPFLYSDTNRRFYTYDYDLRRRFGKKCFKVPLDGGFTCPNIDGTKGRGGCTYCSLRLHSREEIAPLRSQFDVARERLHHKWPDALYIAYFQDFTNTYAPVERLRTLYEEALRFPNVVGMNIATRVDALPDDVVALLREMASRTALTVELGLQSVHDSTARRIHRGHTWEEFLEGYRRLEGIDVCVHLINGLPGEDKEMMLESVRAVAALHPRSVKLHLLHLLRGTQMAAEYERGEFELLTLEQYADIVVSQLELLPEDVVIARLTGDGLADELIGPLWSRKKFVVMNEIDKLMVARNTWQGRLAEKDTNNCY